MKQNMQTIESYFEIKNNSPAKTQQFSSKFISEVLQQFEIVMYEDQH